MILGNVRSDNGDGNENDKKNLISQTCVDLLKHFITFLWKKCDRELFDIPTVKSKTTIPPSFTHSYIFPLVCIKPNVWNFHRMFSYCEKNRRVKWSNSRLRGERENFPFFKDFSSATINSSHAAEKSRCSLEDANSDVDIFVAGAAIVIAYVHCS